MPARFKINTQSRFIFLLKGERITGRYKAGKREIYAFWTSVLRDENAEIKDRIRISELLAKAMDLFSPPMPKEAKPTDAQKEMSLEEKLEMIQRIKTMESVFDGLTGDWYERLRDTTNDTFMPLYADRSRYLVLKGGAGSGKSIFAGRKVLERMTSECAHRILVLRKVARTLRESCYAQLNGQIAAHYDGAAFKIHHGDMRITHANGSQILFAGLDAAEKLKSIYNITMMWIEEASEITQSDFNQLDLRLRGETPYYKQIILTFNPVNVNHWLKHRFFDEGRADVTTHHSTYRDNRFLDTAAVRVLQSYKDTDMYYYTVYCLGECGEARKSIYDAAGISKRLAVIGKPLYCGYFDEKGRFVEENNGYIKIYLPCAANVPYVIGGDTAGEGSDYAAAQVVEHLTGKQAAVFHARLDEDVYARQLYLLGMHYNRALIGVEANFSSYPIRELERLNYPNQYVRVTEDTYTHKAKRSFGFKTTQITRPVIISGLVQAMRENIALINDGLRWKKC
jgi:phage terminase large subunit